MLPLRPVRPADSRAFLVSVLRRLDRLRLDAFTPGSTRPNTGR
jgi:hypothetical protein